MKIFSSAITTDFSTLGDDGGGGGSGGGDFPWPWGTLTVEPTGNTATLRVDGYSPGFAGQINNNLAFYVKKNGVQVEGSPIFYNPYTDNYGNGGFVAVTFIDLEPVTDYEASARAYREEEGAQ